MADKKISQLTGGGAAQATDEYVIARSGNNFKVTGANVAAAATSVGTLSELNLSGRILLSGSVVGAGPANRYMSGGATANSWYFNVPTGGNYYFAAGENIRWRIDPDGHFIAGTDNSFDIGASGANRPRNVFVAGNLAVDTNTLFVDAANNRVGVGTASPATFLDVVGGNNDGIQYRTATRSIQIGQVNSEPAVSWGSGTPLTFFSSVELMRLSSAGNLGLGVTPSAWGGVGVRAFDVGTAGAFVGSGADAGVIANALYNGTNWVYKLAASNRAARYQILVGSGEHQWFTAPSGTAGNAITFTQAMTLVSSGNLLIGTASDAGNRLQVVDNTNISPSNSAAGQVRVEGSGFSFAVALDSSAANLYTNSSLRALAFGTDETVRWSVAGNGHFLAGVDNTYDIGASGATRPRSVYVGTSVVTPTVTNSNTLDIAATGANIIMFATNSVNRWYVGSTGHFFANSDNTLDIGASGANRPRDLFVARNATFGAVGQLSVDTVANASLTIANNSATGSTIGTASLFFRHAVSGAAGAIRAGRDGDYSTGANSDSHLAFFTAENNSDVERMRLKSGGQVRFVPLAAAPTTNVEDGDVYYDSGTNKLRVRAGGAWTDLH